MDPLDLPVHPRTGLTAVGIVAGRPVWPILGAEDDPSNPVQPPAEGAPSEGAPADDPADPDKGADVDDDPADDPADPADPAAGTATATEKARKQAAAYRTRARDAEKAKTAAEAASTAATTEAANLKKILEGLNKVLNPEAPKDEPVDPKALAEQLATERAAREKETTDAAATIRTLTVQAALPRVLAKLDADPDLTEAVLISSGALAALDPAAKTFTANLESAVKAALEKNPKLKVTAPVTRSGVEVGGASGATDQLTLDEVRSMSPEAISVAQKAGRLKAVLGG